MRLAVIVVSGSAWSVAAKEPLSAPCTASRLVSTTSSSWLPARLSSDPVRAKASAKELGIADDRAYGSFEEMARVEAARADGIEAVSIVTPNHMHSPVAKAFLEAGIHVICDKPLTTTVAEAEELVALVEEEWQGFVVTHNYTGYPHGPAGPRHGREWRPRRDPAGPGRISRRTG